MIWINSVTRSTLIGRRADLRGGSASATAIQADQLGADELRARAAKVRAMGAKATKKHIQNALYRLAERHDRRADNHVGN